MRARWSGWMRFRGRACSVVEAQDREGCLIGCPSPWRFNAAVQEVVVVCWAWGDAMDLGDGDR